MSECYKKGFSYEIFIRRAYRCHQTLRNGADGSIFQNLCDTENGNGMKYLGSFEKQFIKVKEYISKAIDKFIKPQKNPSRRLNADEIKSLEELKSELQNCLSSEELYTVVNKGLDITQDYK